MKQYNPLSRRSICGAFTRPKSRFLSLFRYKYAFIIFIFILTWAPEYLYGQKPLSIIIMGFGGRAQWLLMKCLEQKNDIIVTAICDDKALECIEYMRRECDGPFLPVKNMYNAAINQAEFFPDTPQGIQSMLQKYKEIDLIWVTSRNDRHFDHLTNALQHSSCKKIFMEKPLFRTLHEFDSFNSKMAEDRNIVIGLTLRYSSMAGIVSQQLKANKERLGALREVKAWERLSFTHALTAFVLGNRHFRSLWGGLLLEKSIHDIDLALFYISSIGFQPTRIILNTFTDNRFFTRSNQQQILNYCGDNSVLKKKVSEVLESYPITGQFNTSDLIPDYHRFSASLFASGSEPVKFEVETDMSSYRSTMDRGTTMTFENGVVQVDVMASRMTIKLNDGTILNYELNTLHGGHADGDQYVVSAILNDEPIDNHFRATIFDPVVQLATIIALVSEEQALYQCGAQEIYRMDESWVIPSVRNK